MMGGCRLNYIRTKRRKRLKALEIMELFPDDLTLEDALQCVGLPKDRPDDEQCQEDRADHEEMRC